VIEKALLGEDIYIYGDGNYIRDFVRVDDVVQSIVATIDSLNNLRLDEYQVGTGLATTISEMVGLIVDQVQMIGGIRSKIKYRDFPEGTYSIDRRNSIAFTEPFIKDTNWHPKWSPVTGIADLLHRVCQK
jgi:nucleoside-diphosphate-sugar epimerase